MAYERIFIPLENEAAGYDFKGRTPAGRCLAENRNGIGKITIWAQDIRPLVRYSVYLIFCDEGKYAGVQIGSLNADEKGKAEIRKDIESAALFGFALSLVGFSEIIAYVFPIIGYLGIIIILMLIVNYIKIMRRQPRLSPVAEI